MLRQSILQVIEEDVVHDAIDAIEYCCDEREYYAINHTSKEQVNELAARISEVCCDWLKDRGVEVL